MSELENEVEIDLGRLGRSLLRGWWLIVLGIVLGGIIGFLAAQGGGELFQARAGVYLGQPLSTSGSSQLQSLQTNPSSVGQIVRGQALVRSIADQVGLGPAALRRNTSTRTVPGALTRNGQTPLVEVIVRGTDRDRVSEAANLFAAAVVVDVSSYADAKIGNLEELIAEQESELARIDQNIEQTEALLADETVPATQRAVVVLGAGDQSQRRGALVEDRAKAQLDLTVAQEVERGRVVNTASATKVDARSSRSSIVVGAVVGGIIGIALALLLPAIRSRMRGQSAG